MANKANQNKKDTPRSASTQHPTNEKKKLSETNTDSDDDNTPAFPGSLNEELDELLKKNPRRFFGGCGG